MILGVLAATGLAGVIGWQLSRIVIAPVTRLSEEIKRLDPANAATEFASRYPGAELGEIARAFDQYLQRLGEFVSRERAFAEDASHELRTPIAVINTAVERLTVDPELPPQNRPVVDRIGRAGRQMQGTVAQVVFRQRPLYGQRRSPNGLRLADAIGTVIDRQRSDMDRRQVVAAQHRRSIT